ncbi:MAG: septum formation inhibitor Maf [Desulfuromonas sp.]|uniref:Maf family nucleotide pyrophosphatase n=1 Tax=Desulfuromonas sp. TaxID=892 RepID=UPI000CA6E3C7|nr:Maf family nucleotide pyrophosphatase [Desulfuromonas sp.]PLX86628.1 MAG: septum formation inhibitor Maf [Desulfuromonas sp.]
MKPLEKKGASTASGKTRGIVLASASPRRRELLASVGIEFDVVPSRAPEEELPGETPEQHVIRLSRDKAREVASRDDVAGRWFIGSDTIVLRDGDILGKPKDAPEAADMLRSLSGRSHRVLSGYAVHDRHDGGCVAGAAVTAVRFKELTEQEIAGYIATGEPFDKAGSYAIQGIGAFMVLAIEGSYTNVVGLPLCEVVEVLENLGAARLFAGAP